MAITQDILTVYSALAEHIYRRDSNLDQALNIEDIAGVLGLDDLPVPTLVNGNPLPISVTGQDGETLGNLQSDGNYYYSERGFVGMIVEVGGKHVVVLRGTDTTLSGWSDAWRAAFGDRTGPGRHVVAGAAAHG